MPDEKSEKPPGAPWRREAEIKAEAEEPKPEPAPKERSIHGLAAELKNEIRADRIRQAQRKKESN